MPPSGPSEYFDESAVLDESLDKVTEAAAKLESADVLRKVGIST